ncbi:MAG: LLM class flavin-dependent oxidoreductase, partial [Acidimicrobiales bacterium]
MARPCRIGVQLPEVERHVGWEELLAMARSVEEAGCDSLWVGDHLLYDLPGVGARGPWEAWTSLAALAAVTERVQLGPLVASIGFHQPTMLAKQAATVDAISGGRLVVGLGAGWNEHEYRAFGFAFDRRVDRFAEAFTVIRRLLAGERVDWSGEFYEADGCLLDPPCSRPGGPPLLVGSVGPRMLRLTLPHVAAWNAWWADFGNSPRRYRELCGRVDEISDEVGRDPADVDHTAAVLVRLAGGEGRVMGDYGRSEATPMSGPPARIAEELAAFAEAGASHLQLVLDPLNSESIATVAEV